MHAASDAALRVSAPTENDGSVVASTIAAGTGIVETAEATISCAGAADPPSVDSGVTSTPAPDTAASPAGPESVLTDCTMSGSNTVADSASASLLITGPAADEAAAVAEMAASTGSSNVASGAPTAKSVASAIDVAAASVSGDASTAVASTPVDDVVAADAAPSDIMAARSVAGASIVDGTATVPVSCEAATDALAAEAADAVKNDAGNQGNPTELVEHTRADWHRWPDDVLPKPGAELGNVLRVFCGVWNLHGKQAPEDISEWVTTQPKHHVYVIGTCEVERSIAKSVVFPSKARWEQQVRDHLGEDYFMIGAETLSAIHVMVFLHKYLWRYCWDIKTGHVATGVANLIGNKGGTQIGFRLGHTSVLVTCAHLAAHVHKMRERTQSLTRILLESPIRRDKAGPGVHRDYDRVFFMGDLNPRLEANRDDVEAWLAEGQLAKCLQHDQLSPLLKGAPATSKPEDALVGMWPLFDEAPIAFPPTYKFDLGSENYDTSKKRSVPSWTDRILWKRDKAIKPLSYGSVPSLKCSDHRPIFAQFEVAADLENFEGPLEQTRDTKSSVCCVQ